MKLRMVAESPRKMDSPASARFCGTPAAVLRPEQSVARKKVPPPKKRVKTWRKKTKVVFMSRLSHRCDHHLEGAVAILERPFSVPKPFTRRSSLQGGRKAKSSPDTCRYAALGGGRCRHNRGLARKKTVSAARGRPSDNMVLDNIIRIYYNSNEK